MCAKKTPTTPTKQNALTGVAKAPVKKASVAPKQTTKTKADDALTKSNLTSVMVKDVKASSDGKKSDAKASATSNKKASKLIVGETKASQPTTPIKGSIKASVKDAKKASSRDNSADNVKGKKQPPINGKANKLKANDSDRDKLAESKSNHIRDSKINVKNDEVKSKSNSTNEQCNKFEKSLSSLSLKSNDESDNATKDKDKSNKKTKPVASSNKVNKKAVDKAKSSKIVKKASKECKIKISNELKNLGIEMSKSNSSLAVVIQEGMTSGVKTSICEMVKTKARFCSNFNIVSPPVKKAPSEAKMPSNKTNKESQEKVTKDVEVKVKAINESVEAKKIHSEVIETTVHGPSSVEACVKPVVSKGMKISALVNAKNSNKIKASSETNKCELVGKSDESEVAKPTKRKYVKKKKTSEDVADGTKNSANVSEGGARNSDKINQNKSNCANISDSQGSEIKCASKADTKIESKSDGTAVGKKDKMEASTAVDVVVKSANKAKTAPKSKNQLQEGSKAKQVVATDERMITETPVDASKIKRKYVKKAKSIQSDAVDKPTKPQKDSEKPKAIKDERDKSSEANKKIAIESQKNGIVDKKPKNTPTIVKDDGKKSPEKLSKPTTPKKEALKVEAPEKVVKSKSLKGKVVETEPNEKSLKASPKKQKVEIKQEEDPLGISSCESENSMNGSDSDSEISDKSTFKKPTKPPIQRKIRKKKHLQMVVYKQSRVASLNASAKVHCMYENEGRSTLDTSIAKTAKKTYKVESSDDEDEEECKEVVFVLKR